MSFDHVGVLAESSTKKSKKKDNAVEQPKSRSRKKAPSENPTEQLHESVQSVDSSNGLISSAGNSNSGIQLGSSSDNPKAKEGSLSFLDNSDDLEGSGDCLMPLFESLIVGDQSSDNSKKKKKSSSKPSSTSSRSKSPTGGRSKRGSRSMSIAHTGSNTSPTNGRSRSRSPSKRTEQSMSIANTGRSTSPSTGQSRSQSKRASISHTGRSTSPSTGRSRSRSPSKRTDRNISISHSGRSTSPSTGQSRSQSKRASISHTGRSTSPSTGRSRSRSPSKRTSRSMSIAHSGRSTSPSTGQSRSPSKRASRSMSIAHTGSSTSSTERNKSPSKRASRSTSIAHTGRSTTPPMSRSRSKSPSLPTIPSSPSNDRSPSKSPLRQNPASSKDKSRSKSPSSRSVERNPSYGTTSSRGSTRPRKERSNGSSKSLNSASSKNDKSSTKKLKDEENGQSVSSLTSGSGTKPPLSRSSENAKIVEESVVDIASSKHDKSSTLSSSKHDKSSTLSSSKHDKSTAKKVNDEDKGQPISCLTPISEDRPPLFRGAGNPPMAEESVLEESARSAALACLFFDQHYKLIEKEKVICRFQGDEIILGSAEPIRTLDNYAEYQLKEVHPILDRRGLFPPLMETTRNRIMDRSTDGSYSLKIVRRGLLEIPGEGPAAAADVALECCILHNLPGHPNIAHLYGINDEGLNSLTDNDGTIRGGYFMITDRIREVLPERLDAWRNKQGYDSDKNKFSQRLEVALDISSALQFLHERKLVFHIRPSKVGFDTKHSCLKLFNFCEARLEGMKEQSQFVTLTTDMSSLRYAAPEVLCNGPIKCCTDVYSFAILLWEILSLKYPFEGLDDRQTFVGMVVEKGVRPRISPKWPPEIGALLHRCWDPRSRLSMTKVTEELERLLLF